MNRVCRTEGHDYPKARVTVNGAVMGTATSSVITGVCRRCGADSEVDPIILSIRLTQLARDFREFRNDVDVLLSAIDDRLTALEANGPQIVVNNAAPATEGVVDAEHLAYREGRATVWRELRAYVEQNVEVAGNAPGVAVKR